jgi:hypothetical protein
MAELKKKEFPWIRSEKQFGRLINRILRNPSAKKNLPGDRKVYWDERTQTVVIVIATRAT